MPWLAVALRAVPQGRGGHVRLPAGEWLLARARRGAERAANWRQWLIDGSGLEAGVLERLPAGPCAHMTRHGALPGGTWACARPVHLLTGLDHLQLSPAPLDLDAQEGAALLADINRHLDGTGWRFHPSHDGEWMLECPQAICCTTLEPSLAAGRNLRELMPGGPDGARVRSLMNELQMLLHAHPVNESRERRGEPTVNSLWLWGFGAALPPAARLLPTLYADDAWLEGLWRAHGAAVRPLAQFDRGVKLAGTLLACWSSVPATSPDEYLAQLEAQCFLPARAALQAGRTGGIDLLAGEVVFTVSRRARLSFWRRPRPLAEALS